MDIPFESFSKLVYRLGHPPVPRSAEDRTFTPSEIFTSWLNHLARPFPAGSGQHLFRVLFPYEGARRRYGLKETKLAYELERVLGVKGLIKWDSAGGQGDGNGCLGIEVERLMRERGRTGSPTLTLAQLDYLLDNLAAHSPFSQMNPKPNNPPPQSITLSKLFKDSYLSPYAAGLLVQIILQDVRPYLDPLPSLAIRNPTSMLRKKSTEGPSQLDLLSAMVAWDSRMADLYVDGKGDIDWCADMAEAMQRWDGDSPMDIAACEEAGPKLGVNVQIPKCLKGRSVEHALDAFSGTRHGPPASTIWAETKYDGYRMQIHVEIKADDDVKITIFSKSKRNATLDRVHAHSIILATLGLPIHPGLPQHPTLIKRLASPTRSICGVSRSVVLEAEVIPYNEGQREGGRGPGIEEFWWLGSAGVTAGEDEYLADQAGPSDPSRHLCLAFFDIVHLDGKSLLRETYEKRRTLLESVVRPIQGFAFCGERQAIDLTRGRSSALNELRQAFHRSNDARQEGLVLKAGQSTYLDNKWRWVKLKKDYIPNLGDCIDLVVLGAGWDVDRARELRVDTSVLTTFYIGVLTNLDRVVARVESPHFEILFRASYGLDRDALERMNDKIRHGRWRTKPYDKDDPFKRRLIGLSWTYYMPRGMKAPSVLFEHPLCAEVMGAGFLKLPASRLYELRFPRIQKVFEPSERSYSEALTSRGLIAAAHQSLGYNMTSSNPNPSPQDDSLRALWRSTSEVNLIDIPDFPTPSPERPSPRRMQSAPQLPTLKTSPPTPVSSSRLRPTEPAASASHRLTSAIGGPVPSLPVSVSVDEEAGAVLATPVTSPVTKKRLGSPLCSPRTKVANVWSQPPWGASLFTTPPTSPITLPYQSQSNLHPTSLQDSGTVSGGRAVLQRLEVNMSSIKRRTAPKALSLRSRIRRAVRVAK